MNGIQDGLYNLKCLLWFGGPAFSSGGCGHDTLEIRGGGFWSLLRGIVQMYAMWEVHVCCSGPTLGTVEGRVRE